MEGEKEVLEEVQKLYKMLQGMNQELKSIQDTVNRIESNQKETVKVLKEL
ncbi:hypothetical protein AB1K84_18515 [Mesobacillus foraminis]